MSDFSLADMAAVTNGENGWGGSSAWVLIILFALIFGWGGTGFGRNQPAPDGQPVTEAGLCNAMNFNNLENSVGRMSDLMQTQFMQTSQGLASVGYENLRNFADTQSSIKDGDYALSSQLADCCCKTQTAIQGVNYNIERQGCETRAAISEQTQKVLDAISANRMAEMQQQINQLQMQNLMCGVVRYPNQTAYTAGANPFFGQQCCGYGI